MFKDPVMWLNIVADQLFLYLLHFSEKDMAGDIICRPILRKSSVFDAGVIVLGVVWGLWHIPDDLFYTQTSGIQMIFTQITCIALGIFLHITYENKNI